MKKTIAASCGLFAALVLSVTGGAAPPNLLLFVADDMTYTDLGCFGHPDVKTPHLDALAADGCRFTRCYNSAPTCSPLRQSLYTGLYPVRNGAHPNHSRVYDHVRSLPHYLRSLGYQTAIVGKRHEAPASAFPFEMLGGQHHDGGRSPDGADLPLDLARQFLGDRGDHPWCLVVASNQPHAPWNRGDASAYPPDQLTVPPYLVDTPESRQALSKYYAEITYMDRQVGEVVKILNDLGQADNTLTLWLSEQGSQLPYGKWTCYEMGIHAAAIARWPGTIAPGRVSDALISYVDVVPTFVQLAGGDPSSLDLDGTSFAPVLRGEADSLHEYVFSVNTTRGIYHGSEAYGIRSVTDGDWLLIRNLHPENRFENMVTFRSDVFASWKRTETPFARQRVSGYQQRPATELFQVSEDPWCLNNLADQTRTADTQQRLTVALEAWMKQQGDRGRATEMSAETRQPAKRPWARKNGYALSSPARD
ncbi:sulfatase [Roseiconus nitratireducens]|uniref:Sulfatase n=1 Tax=Roseiconus nitratireducens TaxID=2605748 RepID=A0A5M6DDA3_9BACT|nr:sulfatase [Roseiconus nitratireducens]KAA5545504.1 sulfatase [Roseiconus nitratireducens]